MSVHHEDGPLPGAERPEERLTLRALDNLLPMSRFLLRADPGRDKGVDRYLELQRPNGFTNFRSQLQLKGTDATKSKADGSYSVSVRTSNLNYLVRGVTCPLYVLYVVRRNELRYAWADDEARRIEQANPDWMSQKWIKIHFKEVLSHEALDLIEERIIRETTFRREMMEAAKSMSNLERAAIFIDPKTLTVHDPDVAMMEFCRNGIDLIADGHFDTADLLYDTLRTDQKETAQVRLINGYMLAVRGRLYEALGVLGGVHLQRSELSQQEAGLLQFLLSSIRYQTQKISQEEYARELEVFASQGDDLASLAIRQTVLRFRFLSTDEPALQSNILDSIRHTVAQIAASSGVPLATILHAKLGLLGLEGALCSQRLIDLCTEQGLKVQAGFTTGLLTGDQVIEESVRDFEAKIADLLREALDHSLDTVTCEAYLVRSMIRYTMVGLIVMLRPFAPLPEPVNLVAGAIEDADQAKIISLRLGSRDVILRADLVKAKIYEALGQHHQSGELAAAAAEIAQAMGNELIAGTALKHQSGNTSWSIANAEVSYWMGRGREATLANYSDEELQWLTDKEMKATEATQDQRTTIFDRWVARRETARQYVERSANEN